MIQKTTLPGAKEMDTTRKWHYFDASGQILGRLASRIAVLLIGKHKRTYTPNMDCGDFIVVTNVAKIKITGNKEEDKFYFRHSGYAAGAKTIPYKRQMQKDPTKVLELAVKRMLDPNKLRQGRLRRLKMFAGTQDQYGPKTEKKVSA
ncbi:MAG TPA: 50S ribosomal protein L13 [Elusimicrobiales bacterium]|nr:50S ribosomal protein L13 [Elusimicrobiales bacterium]